MFLPVLCLIAATCAARWWLDDRRTLPYFPIEISRQLATGHHAANVFLCILIIIAFVYGYSDPWRLLACVCTFGVVAVPDNVSWLGHMACVWTLLGLVAVRTVWLAATASIVPVVVALALYAVRILIKVAALNYWEGIALLDVKRLFTRSQEIMTNDRPTQHEWVLLAFQLGGVIQWTAFLLMASVM